MAGKLDNEKLLHVRKVEPPKSALPPQSGGSDHVRTLEDYERLYAQSINDPQTFFGDRAREYLTWSKDFDTVLEHHPSFEHSPKWFQGGKINAAVNAVDRHAKETPDKAALIYEADEPGEGYIVTYQQLLEKVSKMANLLKELGVKKGDVVTIYLPMVPEAVIAMLATVRLGAIHSCVFAGFSPAALRDRIVDANSKVLVTIDKILRATKVIDAKKIADEALSTIPGQVEKVIVVQRPEGKTKLGAKANLVEGRDIDYHTAVEKLSSVCESVPVDSEHPLFLLYTSGSTGKPKGMQHSTAGYMLGALLTTKHIFGLCKEDILFTAGDIGWITGHTYAVYGPLLNGATSIVFESTPVYPSHTRYWDIVDKYKATQFYVAPTALRLLRQYGHEDIAKYDLSSLRTLGSVGEPIAEEVWEWYFEYVGRRRCTICDTYWLTESGSVLCSSITGVTPMKPGAAGYPFFGIKPEIIDAVSGKKITDRPAEGVLAISQPWPSMARTIHGDYKRYQDTYLKPYSGYFFTGDGAAIDHENFVFVSGRIDDVVNVSGHRLSTAEVEACFLEGQYSGKSMITEAAVVGIEDELTGQAIVAFVVLEPWLNEEIAQGRTTAAQMAKEAVLLVRKEIGPFAAPRKVVIVDDLPKTRSGKIMRRVLRKIVSGEVDQLGELSTLSNPQIIPDLIKTVQNGN